MPRVRKIFSYKQVRIGHFSFWLYRTWQQGTFRENRVE